MNRSIIESLDEYQTEAMRTAGDYGSLETRLLYGALAIAGESGEVVEAVKKQLFHGVKKSKGEILAELGDVLWGVAYMTRQLGFSLSEVATGNIEKLRKRYPNKFVLGGGIRIVDGDENDADPED